MPESIPVKLQSKLISFATYLYINWSDLRDNGLKAFLKRKILTAFDKVERIRRVDITVLPLGQQQRYFSSVFVPVLYHLAIKQSLSCQLLAQRFRQDNPELQEESAYLKLLEKNEPVLYAALYREDGTAKTPFELALVFSSEVGEIEKRLKKEYEFRRDKKLAFPAFISKYSAAKDYLSLEGCSMLVGDPVEISLNLGCCNTPGCLDDHRSFPEQAMDGLGAWMGYFGFPLMAGAGVIALNVVLQWTLLTISLMTFSVMYFTHRTVELNFYKTLTSLHEEFKSFFFKDFASIRHFDPMRTLETLLFTGTTLATTFLAMTSTWFIGMQLGWLTPFVGFLSLVSGLSVLSAFDFAKGYFQKLGFYDIKLDFSDSEMRKAMEKLIAWHKPRRTLRDLGVDEGLEKYCLMYQHRAIMRLNIAEIEDDMSSFSARDKAKTQISTQLKNKKERMESSLADTKKIKQVKELLHREKLRT